MLHRRCSTPTPSRTSQTCRADDLIRRQRAFAGGLLPSLTSATYQSPRNATKGQVRHGPPLRGFAPQRRRHAGQRRFQTWLASTRFAISYPSPRLPAPCIVPNSPRQGKLAWAFTWMTTWQSVNSFADCRLRVNHRRATNAACRSNSARPVCQSDDCRHRKADSCRIIVSTTDANSANSRSASPPGALSVRRPSTRWRLLRRATHRQSACVLTGDLFVDARCANPGKSSISVLA